MRIKNIVRLILCIALPLVIGGISGFLSISGLKDWYVILIKPSFNPPSFIFGPVWTVLYILMGISSYLILNTEPGYKRTRALIIYGLQLLLNFWWSIFFFTFKRPDIAMIDIMGMWFCIFWMVVLFIRLKPIAGYLQIPYLLWVTFASMLNAAIWILN